jgi:chromosome segregation protein
MDIYLEKIELHGFKSFPDKTKIKLHEGITAIIGPNGCGKSNIVDAILWVLGEQKIRNLRGETNEDLIFNGSSSNKPLGMTEVGAYFKFRMEDVFIARRYFRSNESKYILNDKICRNKDIQDKLFEMGIGDRKYFIFEQGSIDKLISLKSSEKRILIEEAANISHYLARKKEAAQKLIISEQNLNNIEILINDKNDRLKELKNQANYCNRYRVLQKEKIEFLKYSIAREFEFLSVDQKKIQTEMEKLLSNETLVKREITESEKKIMQFEKEKWEIEQEIKNKQKDRFEVNNSIYSITGEISKLKQKIEFDDQKSSESGNSIKRIEDEFKEADLQLIEHLSERKELKQELSTDKYLSSGTDKLLLEKTEKKEKLKTRMDEINKLLFPLQSKISNISNTLENLDRKIDRTRHEIEGKNSFIKTLQQEINSRNYPQLLREKEKSIKDLDAEKLILKRIEERYNCSLESKNVLKNKLIELKNEISNLQNQMVKFIEIRGKITGSVKAEETVKTLGIAHDLIKTEKKNFKLLENFYFEEIDSLLLDTNSFEDQDLKSNKYLLQRESENIDEILKKAAGEPGYISTIKQLFTSSQAALSDRLKDGVLVDNLTNGLRIFEKYSIDVITLDMVILTKNGILIKNRDRGILDVINEIRGIEQKISRLFEDLKQNELKYEKIIPVIEKEKSETETKRAEVLEYEKRTVQLETETETIKRSIDTNENRIRINLSEIDLLKIQNDSVRAKLKTGLKDKDELNRESELLFQEKEKINKELAAVEREVVDLDKLNIQEKNEKQILIQKDNFLNIRISALKANQKKRMDDVESNLKNIEVLKKEIADLKKEIDINNGKLKDIRKKLEEIDNAIREKEKVLGTTNDQLGTVGGELRKKRLQLEEIIQLRNKTEIDLSSIKKEVFILQEYAFKELNIELKDIEVGQTFEQFELEELKEKIKSIDHRLETMRESNRLNFSAESEYELLEKDYNFHLSNKDDILKAIGNLHEAIEKIDQESRKNFLEAYNAIKQKFIKNFKLLFEGGEATIELSDADGDILESGLEIQAQPPGKRLQNLRLLSGGEKTLTSLAFLFSLFEYRPSPLCIFDEVDASLDEANIQRFLKFLHKLKEKTQFLMITHNFKTMEEADYLYGVSMNEPGVSTIYSVKMSDKLKLIKKNNKIK